MHVRIRVLLASVAATILIVIAAFILLRPPSAPPEVGSTPVSTGETSPGAIEKASPDAPAEAKAPSEKGTEAEGPEEPAAPQGPPLLSGVVSGPGGAIEGARVSLFPGGIALSLFKKLERISFAGQIPDLREIVGFVRGEFERVMGAGISTETDADGRYEFREVRSGSYYIVAMAGGHIPRFGDMVAIDRDVPGERDIRMEAGARIGGRVVDAQGNELPGIIVAAIPQIGGIAGLERIILRVLSVLSGAYLLGFVEARTDDAGAFVLDSLSPGSYTLWARGADRTPIHVPNVPTGSEGIVILMHDGATIEGCIVGSDGRPVPDVPVTLSPVVENISIPIPGAADVLRAVTGLLEEPAATAATAADGSFRMARIPAGRYEIVIATTAALPYRQVLQVEWDETKDLGEIALDAGYSVAGLVRGEDGSTPARAWVQARAAPEGMLLLGKTIADVIEGRHRAPCDGQGRFRLGGLSPGTFEVVATAPGYGVGRARIRIPAESDIEIVIAPGMTLRGYVIDETTGESLAGAVVRAEGLVVESDAEGEFVLAGVTPGGEGALFRPRNAGREETIRLSASHDGYARIERRLSEAEALDPVQIALSPAPTIRGIVLDPDGNPQPLALVRLMPGGDLPYAFRTIATLAATISKPDGRFALECPVVQGPPLRVTATHASYAPAQSETIPPGSEYGQEIELRLGRGATVRGRVTDGRGPLAGVRVTLGVARERNPQEIFFLRMLNLPRDGQVAHSDAEGMFRFPMLSAGSYTLSARKSGSGVVWEETFAIADGDDVERTIELDPGGRIEGQVMDSAGQPVAGARVRAIGEENADFLRIQKVLGGSLASAMTEADGTFEIEGLTFGAYTIIGEKAGYASATSRGVRPGETVALTLTAASILRGVAIDAQTRLPLPRFQVRLEVEGEGSREDRLVAWRTVDDPDGAFEIGGLAAGRYLITAQAPEHVPASYAVALAEGAFAEIVLEVPLAGIIDGRIVDPKGLPVAGAQVALADAVEAGPFARRRDAVSDAEGRFSLEGLTEGFHTLRVRHREFVPIRAEGIGVAPGARTPVELRLEEGFAIEGAVLDPDDRPSEGEPVVIEGPDDFQETVRTDGSGRFRFAGLRPGAHTIRLGRDRKDAADPVPVEIKDKDERDVELRLKERVQPK
ncbi:MAG: carboxypeptidase regulatory-like domain-containing protein [Planctomycetes bacterium]|nr:carboxypeptidase regulatory-like domain-containing protein [Planctomycetota bacterium]